MQIFYSFEVEYWSFLFCYCDNSAYCDGKLVEVGKKLLLLLLDVVVGGGGGGICCCCCCCCWFDDVGDGDGSYFLGRPRDK